MINRLFVCAGLLFICTALFLDDDSAIIAQDDATCQNLQSMIDRNLTPYNLVLGGGELQASITSTIDQSKYADFWSFGFTRPSNEFGTILNDTLRLEFDLSQTLSLEIALFRQNTRIPTTDGNTAYQPIADGEVYEYELNQDGVYVVVVRQQEIVNARSNGQYTITASREFGDDLQPVTLRESIRDESLNRAVDPPQFDSGYQRLTISEITALTHPNAINNVASQGGNGARINYTPEAGIFVNPQTADYVALLGGDLAVTQGEGTERRIFYLKNYDYTTSTGGINGDLNNITGANGTAINLNWVDLQGVWISEACAGFKHQNGTTFITPIVRGENNTLTFTSDRSVPDDFTISVVSPITEGIEERPQRHDVTLNWNGIQPGSMMTLFDGVFDVQLIGDRRLRLESTDISMARQPDETRPLTPAENIPLGIFLDDINATILLDWIEIERVALIGDTLSLTFSDRRGAVERTAVDLRRLEAINANIYTIYGDQAGEQRLWLNADYGFIELITPAGRVPYDSLALPGEADYIAHGLNNTGGECYAVNTALPEANCPSNGHPNPANGNLWMAITDQDAYGGLLDLTLTRSYNSRLSGVDGLFGSGWSSIYRLDYNVAYDVDAGARVINADVVTDYPVGLNVIYAPRGVVTFITDSGSQHTFYATTDEYRGDEQTLTALTMPGWTLNRANVLSGWTLRQNDGMVYQFDPAGRLISYGYPDNDRIITVDYPRDTLTGPAGLDDSPAVITDAPNMRQLELYYDDQHRVTRSVLRSLDGTTVPTCNGDTDALETRYIYDDSRLVEVTYPDCTTATYNYDSDGRLTAHDDPRAPIATRMRYVYDEDGFRAAFIADDDSRLLWRYRESLQITRDAMDDPDRRIVTLAGDEFAARSYTYDLRVTNDITERDLYTLIGETSPLASDDDTFESRPILYNWENGLLDTQFQRGIDLDGRNRIDYEYTANGVLRRVFGGYPTLSANFDSARLDGVTFADGTTIALTYDGAGLVENFTDRQGNTQSYTWNPQNRPQSITGSDGVTHTYSYNALGQVESVTRGEYTVRYIYDSLGRLILVDDPLTGAYTVSYPTLREINVTDATGATAVTTFDVRGRVTEQRLDDPITGAYLRRTTYTYDAQDRLTGESRWLAVGDEGTGSDARPITTEYRYVYGFFDYTADELVRDPDVQETVTIDGETATLRRTNGYTITVREAIGAETRIYTFDALNRVRQVADAFQQITRYDYAVDEVEFRDGRLDNGLRIIQRDLRPNGNLITEYLFDSAWQLRFVRRSLDEDVLQTWQLNRDSRSTVLNSASYPGSTFQTWSAYSAGDPGALRVVQQSTGVNEGQQLAQQFEVTYDTRGRPVEIRDSEGNIYRTAYCPQADGGTRVITDIFTEDTPLPDDLCEFNDPLHSTTYDAAGRIVAAQDTNGTRTYTYETRQGRWIVTMTVNDVYTWDLRYNSAGDLRLWIDESGIRRNYSYDTLGRLTAVETLRDDATIQPDASFTFTYNDGGLLTAVVDGLGRGTLYGYDPLDQLTVVQDASTGNSTIYGYTNRGQLSRIISPLGSNTSFSYDPIFPGQITGIIDAAGSQTRYRWDIESNILTVTDPRNRAIEYLFDSAGALWRINDRLQTPTIRLRAHVFDYDTAGRLTGWDRVIADDLDGYELSYPDPLTFTLTVDDWNRTFERTPDNQLTGFGDLAFGYDPFGRLTRIAAGESRVWQLAYAPDAQRVTVIDGFGSTFDLTYDALNRLVRVADGDTTSYSYEPGSGDDLVLSVTEEGDPTGRTVTFSPGDEGANEARVIVSAPGQERTYIYDQEGLLVEILTEICLSAASLADCREEDPDAIQRTSERFLYDALGRPIRYIDPEENIATFAYDDAGNLVNYQNVAGQTFTYLYDEFNRLVELLGPTGIRLILDYDGGDNVTGICRTRGESDITYADCLEGSDEGVLVETYEYDALRRLVEQRLPGSSITYDYDENSGLLNSWGNAEGERVTIDRSNDGLDLLRRYAIGDNTRYEPTYGSLNHLESITSTEREVAYAYDTDGRLVTISTGNRTLTYDYAEDGRGYTIRDSESDAALRIGLNTSGLLAEIEAVSTAEVTIDYTLTGSDRSLLAIITWSNGELVELDINRDGSTGGLVYLQNLNLLVDYTNVATGQIQSGVLTGSPGLFGGETNGYITQIGYDADGRPSTLRVTGRTDGNRLYLLTFTYNADGRRDTESRQFRNNDQVTIDYRYDDAGHLTSRVFTVTRFRSIAANGTFLILLLPLVGWAMRGSRRRLLLVLLVTGLIAGALFDRDTRAQQVEQFSQFYTYDDSGNLTDIFYSAGDDQLDDIDGVCASFTYDAANRLIGASNASGTFNPTYEYDIYNRLIRAGDSRFAYIGDSDTLMARFETDGTIIYGQTADRAGFFLSGDDETEWLITDGRRDILATVSESTEPDAPLRLSDPLGRPVDLDSTAVETETQNCGITPNFTGVSFVQTLEPDMILDAETNLYFKDGRAYSPQLGIYLQRDPLGPDVFGNVYAYPARQAQPPVRVRPPFYAEGLYQLEDAYDAIMATQMLTAQHVRERYLPSWRMVEIMPLLTELEATANITQAHLLNQLVLPMWIRDAYNLPAPYLDNNGAVRLVPDNAPGQGGRVDHTMLPELRLFPTIDLLPQIAPPMNRLTTLIDRRDPQEQFYTTFQPFAWQPNLPALTDHAVDRPQLTTAHTPSAMLAWLPQPLYAPQDAATTLRAAGDITDLPHYPGSAWVEAALDTALPGLPDLPPPTADVWLANWFTRDTLGVARPLSARYPDLPGLDVPVYTLGENLDWFRLD